MENKKATSTMVSPVIILSRLAATGSQRRGETKILSLGIPPLPPPPQKKKVKKKWALGDDGFNLLFPQSTDNVPESGDETDSVRVIGNCRNCQDFTDPGLLKIRLTLTGGLSVWFCLQKCLFVTPLQIASPLVLLCETLESKP